MSMKDPHAMSINDPNNDATPRDARSGEKRYEDPTQGREFGSDPYEDSTRAR